MSKRGKKPDRVSFRRHDLGRATKNAFRAARRKGKPIGWSEAQLYGMRYLTITGNYDVWAAE